MSQQQPYQRRNHRHEFSTLDEDIDVELNAQDPPIERDRLGKDDDQALCLPLDGQPVSNVVKRSVASWFWSGENHRWPADVEVLRIARYFDFPLERAVALAVKGQFERHFSTESGHSVDERPNGHCWNSDKARELSRYFELGLGRCLGGTALYAECQKLDHWAEKSGYDLPAFEDLLERIQRVEAHLIPSRSPRMALFVQQQQAQLIKLKSTDAQERDLFYRLELRHAAAEDLLGEWLLENETQLLRMAKLERQWMGVFGDLHLPIVEHRLELLKYQKRIELKELDPDALPEVIERQVSELQSQWRDSLEELREDLALAKTLAVKGMDQFMTGGGVRRSDPKEVAEYEKELRKLLLKIHHRTHPNLVDQENFSDEQRGKLRAYFDEAQGLNKKMRHYSGTDTLFDVVPMTRLQGILARVMLLWNCIGIDFDEAQWTIPGSTLGEQIAWLQKDIARIEGEISNLRDDIRQRNEHEEVRTRVASLASEEDKANARAQLQCQLDALQAQLAQAKQRYEELLSGSTV